MYESVRFLRQRERKNERRCIPRSSANRPSEEEETYFSCRDNARSNASFVVVVVVVVVVAFFFFVSVSLRRPSASSKSFPEEDIFHCEAREKDFMKEKDEKKANAEAKKKMCQTDEKRTRKVFSTPCFFCPFPFQSSKRARSLELHS